MLTNIRLQHFRSYNDMAFDLDAGVNIIVGPNASGKTNLLEAVLMICKGSSFRVKSTDQIQFNKPWARIESHTSDEGVRTIKLRLSGDKIDKTFETDNKTYKRLPQNKTLPVVLFEPQNLLMLTGRPDLRREYLDELLAQTVPNYAGTLRAYKRTLAQRNNLLKRSTTRPEDLFAWNVRLSELGSQIAQVRYRLTLKLDKKITKLYQKLSASKARVELAYLPTASIENYSTDLLNKLEDNTEIDLVHGFTGLGPHREDLEIVLKNHKAQETASRGEIRTLLLSLKILESYVLEELRQTKPILLLDDVFSELDGARRQALTGYLRDYQTFITTTDADLVAHNFAQKCHIISLS